MILSAAVLLLGWIGQSFAVIYHLTEHEYSRMPPLFHLDPYNQCISRDGGRYCYVSLHLVADEPNELYHMIQEYSERVITHFNHTILKRGICISERCTKSIAKYPQDLRLGLEACFNKSFYKDYELKTRVNEVTCHEKHEEINIDNGDTIVAVFLALLLFVNIVGSLYAIFWKDSKQGILHCFSIRHNVQRLLAGPGGPEPRLTRLQGINGLKAITMFMVIGIHSLMPFFINVDNPQYMEESYSSPGYCFIANGTPAVQTFFVVGGFLLAYNIKLHEEKHRLKWTMIFKGLLNRWLRLTPPYAVILAITATWLRHAGSGPLWDSVVVTECEDCRRYWWQQILYINNYIDYSKCMPQMWYVACDIQLHVLGLITCVLLAGTLRQAALAVLLAASMLASAGHTYWQDLDPTVMPSPEASRNFFFTDRTFMHIYKRTHTNVSAYAIGLALGLILYHLQQNKCDIHRILKNRFVYWLTAPGLAVVVGLGCLFYMDTERAPVYVRMIYAVLAKPTFSFLVAVIILGTVYKFESLYRGVLEWRGWTSLGRLSYCAYAVHVLVVRTRSGSQTTQMHASLLNALIEIMIANILSFALAVPLYVLVEAPFGHLLKGSAHKSEQHKKETIIQDTDEKGEKSSL